MHLGIISQVEVFHAYALLVQIGRRAPKYGQTLYYLVDLKGEIIYIDPFDEKSLEKFFRLGQVSSALLLYLSKAKPDLVSHSCDDITCHSRGIKIPVIMTWHVDENGYDHKILKTHCPVCFKQRKVTM
jgi:hypothetical protein